MTAQAQTISFPLKTQTKVTNYRKILCQFSEITQLFYKIPKYKPFLIDHGNKTHHLTNAFNLV